MSFSGGGEDVVVNLIAIDNMTPVLRGASAAMGAFTGNAQQMINGLARMGEAALPILALGGAFIYAGQQASMVQQNVANLNAVLHATADQLAAIRQNGLALSQATQFTDAQILQSQRQLAKGGVSANDLAVAGSSGASGATLNLAGATQTTPTQAATSLVTAQTAFGLTNTDYARSATVLAQAVDSSIGTLQSQASALKQVGATARAAGFDLKDTTTAIADLQNNGMMNDSGTGLKTFIARIEAPTGAAKKEIDALGLSFYDLQGKLKPLPEIFDEIRNKTLGLSQQDANASLSKIFGLRGVRVADIAMEQGSSGLVETAQSMAEKGDAAEINARKLDTFQGSASKAASSINVLAVQMGTTLLPAMKGFADLTTGAANSLSELNNHATLLPQIAVAIGAIAGGRAIGNKIEDRKQGRLDETEAANKAVDEARIANAAGYSNAVAQAEFTADSKIASAHQAMVKELERADQERYEAWVALNEKTADLMIANEAKQIAAVQSITQATLASIAEIEKAQQAAAEATIARSAIQADQQRGMLAIQHQEERARATLPMADESTMPARQVVPYRQARAAEEALERSTLEKQLTLREQGAAQLAEIDKKTAASSIETKINEGQRKIAEEQKTMAAMIAEADSGYERGLALQRAAAEKSIQIEEQKLAAIVALEESNLANKVGGGAAYLGGGGVKIANPGLIEGSILANSTPVKLPTNVSLVASDVIASEEGMLAPIRNKVAALGSRLGAMFMPAMITLTVVELVVQPAIDSIKKKWVEQTLGKPIDLNLFSTDPSQTQGQFGGSISQIDKQIADYKKKVADAKKEMDDANSGNALERATNRFLQGPGHVGTNDPEIIDTGNKEIAALEAKKKVIQDLMDVGPSAALSKANDEITKIVGSLQSETIDQKQAEAQWYGWMSSVDESTNSLKTHDQYLREHGATEEQIAQVNRSFATSEITAIKAISDARQQANAVYKESLDNAAQQAALGGSKDDVAVANFGKHLNASDATKTEIAAAKKEITELETAWKGAQQTVNSIDISKGFDSFAKLSDNIRLANQELARVGQNNPALQALGAMADSFKAVTDQEKLASQAMDGYNLTLQKSQGYLGELGKVQKEFDSALELAERRIAAGRGSDQDKYLVANQSNISANLANQQETISEHMVLDVIGKVTNLPDFAQLDTYVRDVIDKAGGGIKVVASVEANTNEAKAQIEDILKPRHMTIILDPDFTQFDPAIAQRAKQYSDWYRSQGGNSPYDEPKGGPPSSSGGSNPDVGNQVSNPGLYPQGGGGGLGFLDLNKSQYDSIIKSGSTSGTSPFQTPGYYEMIMKAAKDANVDPRAMLATMKWENNFGGNISDDLSNANNFGGVEFAGQQNAEAGPEMPRAEQVAGKPTRYYAAFKGPQDFFNAEAKNLTTGPYQQAYQNGDFEAIRRMYVTGGGPGDDDQKRNIANSVATFNEYRRMFPTGDGGAGAGRYDPSTVSASEHLTTQQSIEQQGDVAPGSASSAASSGSKFDPQAILNAAKKHLGDITQIDGMPWYLWCEKFVGDATAEALGTAYRPATADQHVRNAEAGVAGAGTVISRDQARPGDLVGWEGSGSGTNAQGHIGVYAGGNQYLGTTANGIQFRDIAPGAVFIRPDGVVADGPTPGAVAHNKPSGYVGPMPYRTDATQNPTQQPLLTNVYPASAVPYLDAYGAGMSHMDARSQGEGRNFLNQINPVMRDIYADRGVHGVTFGANRTRDPNASEKQIIDNSALQASLSLTTQVNVAIDAMNRGLPVTAEMYKKIAEAAGPLGPLVNAQVAAMSDLEQQTQKLAQLKDTQQAADTAYQKKVEDRTAANTQIQRGQTVTQWMRQDDQLDITQARKKITEQEADADRSRARNKTLEQRDIDDSRTAQQRKWQDEDRLIQNTQRVRAEGQRQDDIADRNHKQSLDDAYQVLTRQEEDKVRIQNFRGGQESIALQDDRKKLDEQHRVSTEGMQQNASLYVAAGKGAATEAEALANASQAAAINDARVKADELYRKQAEANTRAQDDLSKKHAQEMFDLETETLAAARKHEDEMKAIDRAAQVRHDAYNQETYDLSVQAEKRQYDHEMILRDEADLDKRRNRSYEDQTFQIEDQRIQQKRVWDENDLARTKANTEEDRNYQIATWQREDLAKQDDDNYKASKLANSQLQQQTQENIANDQKQVTGIKDIINEYDTLLKKFGEAAAYASGILNTPIPSVTPGVGGNPGAGTWIKNLSGYATGTGFSAGGDAMVNERGGEMRTLLTGETILPADATRRMFDALTRSSNVSPISSAPSYREGDIHINVDGGSVALSAEAQARIRAIVQREIADASPATYLGRQAATGGLRR